MIKQVSEIIYNTYKAKIKAIYQTGSRVISFIEKTRDNDIVIFVKNTCSVNELQEMSYAIRKIISKYKDLKICFSIDSKNGQLNRYYCLFPYMKKLVGDDVIFEQPTIEKCVKVVKEKFAELELKSYLPMKKWYLLVYDYYILKNNLSYDLTTEQKEILNKLHDNTYENFETLKAEIKKYLNI